MKTFTILSLSLLMTASYASVDDPLAHVKSMAQAQIDSNYDKLYELFQEASGEEEFSATIEANGGEESFRETLRTHFNPFDPETLWVVDSLEALSIHRPEQANGLSVYRTVKPGFKIVFVGDKDKLSYYFFKKEGSKWKLVSPETYAPLPHE